jgi:hypothetical protein
MDISFERKGEFSMKKILGLALLAMVLCTGVVMAQNTSVISAGINWGMTRQIDTEVDDFYEDTQFLGLSFAYTNISSFGLTFFADLSVSFPYIVEGEDGGAEYEINLDDFDRVYNFNIMAGIGFAPINNEAMFVTITVGPNIHLMSYEAPYVWDPIENIIFTQTSFGLAANLGVGFGFGNLYIVANVKGGYNFFGSATIELYDDSDSDTIDDFGLIFVVPSFGVGFKL